MEKFSGDVLGLVLKRVSDRRDRRSCSEVCKQWARVEGLTRTCLRVLEPEHVPTFLPRFPNLTTLEIGKRISDQNLEFIAEMCPNVRTLNLSLHRSHWFEGLGSEDFGDDGLCAVAIACWHLTKVCLKRRERIGDVGVIALIRNAKNLAVLDLSWCSGITDESIEAMGAMSSLTELYLQGCSLITDCGFLVFANGSLTKTLRVLDLSECDQITDHGICFLQQMSCLQELNLSDCGPSITDIGGVAISAISSLRKLDFSWLINLSDDTLFSVAQNSRNLVEIKLTGCELITGEGVRSLAAHGSLEMLALDCCNTISADDVEQTVLQCQSLRHLVLGKTLRGWMSPSAKEKLSTVYRVDWL